MRIAAIDIGSNSIHMVIARAHRPPAFEVVDREREVVQIGRGSFADRRLRRDAMQRTAVALRRFVQLARRVQVERILCTTTAAVREASNGGEFLQLCRELAGITPRVIPAAEEGRLIDLAVRAALRVPGQQFLDRHRRRGVAGDLFDERHFDRVGIVAVQFRQELVRTLHDDTWTPASTRREMPDVPGDDHVGEHPVQTNLVHAGDRTQHGSPDLRKDVSGPKWPEDVRLRNA